VAVGYWLLAIGFWLWTVGQIHLWPIAAGNLPLDQTGGLVSRKFSSVNGIHSVSAEVVRRKGAPRVVTHESI
jgi:hypothetical protein